jgi:hypothetical protein
MQSAGGSVRSSRSGALGELPDVIKNLQVILLLLLLILLLLLLLFHTST